MKKKIVFGVDGKRPFAIIAMDEPLEVLNQQWPSTGQLLDQMDIPTGLDLSDQNIINALVLAWVSGRQFQSVMGGNVAL